MDNSLQTFYQSEFRDNVKAYLVEFLTQKAVEKVFAKEDVSGVAEARELVDEAFENLSTLFDPKPKQKVDEPR